MIEDLLNCKDLYDPTKRENAKPSDMLDANWKKLKNKTLCVIRHWVDIGVYNHVPKRKILILF